MCIFRIIIVPDEYCLSLPTANPTQRSVARSVYVEREQKTSFVRPNNVLLVGDQLDIQFFYITRLFQSSTVSSKQVLIIRRSNFTNTASGIVTLCKWPSGIQVEQELLDLHTGRPLTESDYTRCCISKI